MLRVPERTVDRRHASCKKLSPTQRDDGPSRVYMGAGKQISLISVRNMSF
jgi:hypothetical protein